MLNFLTNIKSYIKLFRIHEKDYPFYSRKSRKARIYIN